MSGTARRIALPPEPRSARQARRFVGDALHQLGADALRERASLLVSEVVTNAILHARTPLTLEVAFNGRTVWIGVTDGSTGSPLQRSYSRDATTGRGLVLLEALSSSWGSTVTKTGKIVWFELQ
jgi:anti-sigma regulatory factor (Ser/Thr protein kinase)